METLLWTSKNCALSPRLHYFALSSMSRRSRGMRIRRFPLNYSTLRRRCQINWKRTRRTNISPLYLLWPWATVNIPTYRMLFFPALLNYSKLRMSQIIEVNRQFGNEMYVQRPTPAPTAWFLLFFLFRYSSWLNSVPIFRRVEFKMSVKEQSTFPPTLLQILYSASDNRVTNHDFAIRLCFTTG